MNEYQKAYNTRVKGLLEEAKNLDVNKEEYQLFTKNTYEKEVLDDKLSKEKLEDIKSERIESLNGLDERVYKAVPSLKLLNNEKLGELSYMLSLDEDKQEKFITELVNRTEEQIRKNPQSKVFEQNIQLTEVIDEIFNPNSKVSDNEFAELRQLLQDPVLERVRSAEILKETLEKTLNNISTFDPEGAKKEVVKIMNDEQMPKPDTTTGHSQESIENYDEVTRRNISSRYSKNMDVVKEFEGKIAPISEAFNSYNENLSVFNKTFKEMSEIEQWFEKEMNTQRSNDNKLEVDNNVSGPKVPEVNSPDIKSEPLGIGDGPSGKISGDPSPGNLDAIDSIMENLKSNLNNLQESSKNIKPNNNMSLENKVQPTKVKQSDGHSR